MNNTIEFHYETDFLLENTKSFIKRVQAIMLQSIHGLVLCVFLLMIYQLETRYQVVQMLWLVTMTQQQI